MTWCAGRRTKELRTERAGLRRRICEREVIKNFEPRRSYSWARDIIGRPIGRNIITWDHTREHASHLRPLVTMHP